MDIPGQIQPMCLCIHQHRFVPPTEKGAVMTLCAIEVLRVKPVDMAHDSLQIPLGRAHQEMVMVVH